MRLAAMIALTALGLLGAAQAEGVKPELVASDRARVASGPSERNEPAAAEVRHTPVGGQTAGGTMGVPPAPEQGKRHE